MHQIQLTLGLALKDEATFANFYSGKNTELIEALKKAISGQGEKVIYLCGSRGQGCSHLLKACCHLAKQQALNSVYLPFADMMALHPSMLNDIHTGIVCLDDLHMIAGHTEWEEAVFHLYNRIGEANGCIIIAAHDLPKATRLQLPDLISRLSWGMVYQLHSLLDEEKLLVLIMRAEHRGMRLSREVGQYMMTHCPRHMGTLFAALDVLDKASLAAQRRLTIPFVKEVLQI